MSTDQKIVQFLANHLALETRFGGPIPSRLRVALADRDFGSDPRNSRLQRPIQLIHRGLISASPESPDAKGRRTFLSDDGEKEVVRFGTRTNLTDEEIDWNISDFGFRPLDGAWNAGTAQCHMRRSKEDSRSWVALDSLRLATASTNVSGTDEPVSSRPSDLSERSIRELLEDLRAEHHKESQALEETMSLLAVARVNALPYERPVLLLEELIRRYEAAAKMQTNEATAAGIRVEIERMRGELEVPLAGLTETRLRPLEARAAVLTAVVQAILEAIASLGIPTP